MRLGLVLLVAVHRNNPVVAVLIGPRESIDERLAIPAVFPVADEVDIRTRQQVLDGTVSRSVIDHQYIRAVFKDLVQNLLDVLPFVVNGDGDQ